MTGGAGYIGGHVVDVLLAAGRRVVVVDDLSTGRADRVPGVPLVRTDLASTRSVDVLGDAFDRWDVTAVVHLAGRKKVAESLERPDWYHEQNVGGTAHVLAAMTAARVRHLVFSSSAAVYGSPDVASVDEDTPAHPVSPYGTTKLQAEALVADATAAGVHSFSLRYFNVAGAASWRLRDDEEANLVTTVLGRLARGEPPQVNGTDYPTPDGTCVRDYIHVADLADSHVAAAQALAAGRTLERVYNLGSGDGVSVREIMTAMAEGTGIAFEPETAPRRPGDPARIVASGELAARDLDWKMRHTLLDMVTSAWQARQAH